MSDLAIAQQAPASRPWDWLTSDTGKRWVTSTLLGVTFWSINFALVYNFVAQFGHGIAINASTSVSWDIVAFGYKKWIWKSRPVRIRKSLRRALARWGVFYLINNALVITLVNEFDMPVHNAKMWLIPLGIIMNPVQFWIDNNVIFQEGGLREVFKRRSRST